MVDTSHQPTLGYIEVVPQCDAVTLLPIIQAHIGNGTTIHSDQWAAYRQVASLLSVSTHSTVNHSVTFVDPVSSTHTQNIESYWGKAKRTLKAVMLPNCLATSMSSCGMSVLAKLKLMHLRTSCCIFQNNTHFNFFTRFLIQCLFSYNL